MKSVYVLMSDGDGTTRSRDEPFGVAVNTESEAKRFVEDGGIGHTDSYQKLTVFDNKDEAIHWRWHKMDKSDTCEFCRMPSGGMTGWVKKEKA